MPGRDQVGDLALAAAERSDSLADLGASAPGAGHPLAQGAQLSGGLVGVAGRAVFGEQPARALEAAAPENNIETGTSCGMGASNGNQQSVSTGALALGALASNGGPTETRAIASGSVAQNAASGDCGGLTVDQRGTSRPQGASCDIGAFELEPPPPSTPSTPAPKKCKKGQKLKKGKCVKKKRKKQK